MKHYREYMDGIQASDTFHWRLLNLEAHKCRPRRLVRAVLVAACLCTTLIGGAFAIQLIGGDFRTINFYEHEWCPPPPGREDVIGQSFSGYVLWGGAITFFPVSSFSEEVQALTLENGANIAYLYFDSLDAAAEYTGMELPKNTALRDLPPARCEVQIDSSDDGLTRLTFNESFRALNDCDGLDLNVRITALSELMYSPDFEMWFDCGFPDSYTYTTEEFHQNGVTAIISYAVYQHEDSPSGPYGEEYYRANLIRDGVVYEIGVKCSDSPKEGRAILEKVLAGF